jgi:hypothetical protein
MRVYVTTAIIMILSLAANAQPTSPSQHADIYIDCSALQKQQDGTYIVAKPTPFRYGSNIFIKELTPGTMINSHFMKYGSQDMFSLIKQKCG